MLDRVASHQELRAVLRLLLDEGWAPVIPTVVLAEAVTGRPEDAPVNQLVNQLRTVVTNEPTARLAGHLRFGVERLGVPRAPSAIDAIVAAHAVQAGSGVVFTTDPTDLRRLLADHPGVVVETP